MVETMNPMDGDSRFDDTRYTDPRYEDRYRSEHDMEYLNEAMPDMHSTGEFRFCAGCGCRIDDRYFLMAADKHWHVHCLQCYDCKLHLDNELTCFVREGNVYCKEDYYRRFSIKCCAKCRHGISANEMVMRARDFVYHVTCFTCFLCNKTLLPGDYFGMRDNMIYCREDYERLMQDEPPQSHGLQPSTSPGVMGGPGLENIPYFPTEPKRTQKGRPRKRKIAAPDTGFRSMGYLTGDPDAPRDGTVGQDGYLTAGQPRQKRVRTSFKHHQLRAMKSYFQLNHNPDAKDLKQLAQKTGLSKRVLQVWFQNARAKYRRHVLKQEQTKGDGSVVADSEFRLSDDEKGDDKTYAELSNNSSSSISDMSSQSINDLPAGMTDFDQQNGGLSELFTNSISAIN